MRVLRLLLVELAGTVVVYGSTIVLRMSEAQFNGVAKDAFHFGAADQTKNDPNTLDSPNHLKVSIPRDGYLRTTAVYNHFIVNGGIHLKLQEMSFFEYSTELEFESCVLVSEGEVLSAQIYILDSITYFDHEDTRTVSFQTKGCVFTCSNVSIPHEFEGILQQYINTSQIIENLQSKICQNYRVNFDLVLKSNGIKVPLTHTTARLKDTNIRVVNSEIILLQQVTFLQSVSNSEPEIDRPRDLPEAENPFEIYISSEMLDESFSATVEELFNENRIVTLSSLAPRFPTRQIQSLGSYIPNLGRTFPNSKFEMSLTNISLSTNIFNNSLWIHGTLHGIMTATLECNPNRTYTAFKYRAIFSAPLEIASDNERVGARLTTFKGNFTILETNIGRIADRFLESVFFVLPQLDLLSDLQPEHLRGMNLSNVLPNGFRLKNTTIKLVQDYIVIGGQLTKNEDEQNVIPFDNLTWVGDLGDADNYFFPLIDNTPENTTGLPIQNCTGPPRTYETSASTSVYHTSWILILFTFLCLLYN